MNQEKYLEKKELLRFLVRSMYDVQQLRIAVGGRVKRQFDPIKTTNETREWCEDQESSLENQEKIWLDRIKEEIGQFTITEWLSGIKGIGETSIAFILSEFDIYRADTVSKLLAFSGIGMEKQYEIVFSLGEVQPKHENNIVSLVMNKKDVEKDIFDENEPEKQTTFQGKRVTDRIPKNRKVLVKIWGTSPKNAQSCIPLPKKNAEELIVYSINTVNDVLQAQRKRVGQKTSYNSWLRTKMLGVVATNFLRLNSPYRQYYDGYRTRLIAQVESVASGEDKAKFILYRSKLQEMSKILDDANLTINNTEDDEVDGEDGTWTGCSLISYQEGEAKKKAAEIKQSANTTLNSALLSLSKLGKTQWKSIQHIHRASLRYMMKCFLIELYVKWRTLEGLPVRPSYQEEKLGHKHSSEFMYP